MLIMAIIAMTGLAAVLDRLDAAQTPLRRAREAAAALQLARTALLGYAAGYRDLHPAENFGYLPCPDTTGSGMEHTPCGKAGKIAVGLLPYKTLGLPDLRDASGNCLWYVVSGSFKSSPKTSPFNWDSLGELSVRDAGGAMLAAPADRAGGAAAVIVAPGPALVTQHRNSGPAPCGADPAQANAYLENDGDIFVEAALVGSAAAAAANDRVVWITPNEIFDLVTARSDFAAFMSNGIAAVQSKLGSQRATAGNQLPSANPFGRQTSDYNFYDAWKDQFRYLRCATAGCYADDSGGRHNAVLAFSGRNTNGSPRQTTARRLNDYFESALALAQGRDFSACSTAPARFDNSSAAARAADMALCLAP